MKTISSTEAQKHFGDLLMQINREPVAIKKHDKEVAVLISIYDFNAILHQQNNVKTGSKLSNFIGLGQDCERFSSVEEVDEFILSNREVWEI